eukprot:CAMPEP_0202885160 /NCGR_PEP_ID=MMETSP1391-20130828/41520_1 /ASSEMBLY_ACC=CAM_ASM_000867 /TAXON_ID=1034604 /ORGANISM="Chlamydomonas leiostraca, Strain SAG 11-49" /LENGTH=122 /DNA_ID=CAMNT_0049568403 /DNA_START=272 /DNA_END=640 /DNA_ORIENTATION=+
MACGHWHVVRTATAAGWLWLQQTCWPKRFHRGEQPGLGRVFGGGAHAPWGVTRLRVSWRTLAMHYYVFLSMSLVQPASLPAPVECGGVTAAAGCGCSGEASQRTAAQRGAAAVILWRRGDGS